jgi:hypothetical protein
VDLQAAADQQVVVEQEPLEVAEEDKYSLVDQKK